MTHKVPLLAAAIMLVAAAVMPAHAQYPSKPLRLVVPFPAGGASDAAARIIGRHLAKSQSQPVVIDNRPGANGAIAGQAVVSAAPDGHTLLWGVGSMVAIPLLQKSAPFDSLGSFASVSTTGQFAFGMFVHPAMPAKTMGEFVRHARANPDKLGYASATMSEYLAAAQFMKASNSSLIRVPYKGGAQALPDLVAGRVQLYFTPVGIALPYTKEGRLRMLGTLLPQRLAAAADVPTMAEAGLASVSVPTWQAVFAPPKTPSQVGQYLSNQLNGALRDNEVRQQFDRLLLQPEGSTPQRLASMIAQDTETWRAFIRENDIPRE